MNLQNPLKQLSQIESINFWVTNRIPRVLATRLMGQLSRIRSPLLTRLMIGIWGQFSDIDTHSTEQRQYQTLQAFFTRGLRPGARKIAENAAWICPSDGIAGASGVVSNGMAMQIKGMPYKLEELLMSRSLADSLEGGQYLTIRLTSGMYHRFHAPCQLILKQVRYISGDVFNVNPPALKRVPSLFCRNERAVLTCETENESGEVVTFYIVAVAAVLVASIRIHALGTTFQLNHGGATEFNRLEPMTKGQEMGWFEQGSTLVLIWPLGADLQVKHLFGEYLTMGEPL